MAQYWSTAVADVVASGQIQPFNFIDIEVNTPVHLTDWHDDQEVDGNLYLSNRLKNVDPPAQSNRINQASQRIEVIEALNDFATDDLISRLGDYYGAKVIARAFVVGLSGSLLMSEEDTFMRSEGFLIHVARSRGGRSVVLEVSNSYGKLDAVKELRTTRGSMIARAPGDTSFDRAAAVDNNSVLEWGT